MNLRAPSCTVNKQKETEENAIKSKSIILHKKSVRYLEAATKLHQEALKYIERSDWERAKKSALKAHDHVALAIEAQKKDRRLMALA
jgi:hypothetical protein